MASIVAIHAVRATSPAVCGGEQLREATFPAIQGATTPDHRSESFLPDRESFDRLLQKTGAIVLMAKVSTKFSHASPSQAANIALVAKKLHGVVIRPGAVFSYNAVAGPYNQAGGYGWGRQFVGDRIVPSIGGGVCQGASTLYNVALLANLPVLEHHFHGLTVPYLPPATDATVTEEGGLDFRFRNNSGGPIVLWAMAQDRLLTIAAYGIKAPPKVTIHSEVLRRTPFSTVTIADPDLPAGSEEVAAAGQDGVKARAWITVEANGTTTTRDIGTHTYRPSPRVILRGTGPTSSRQST